MQNKDQLIDNFVSRFAFAKRKSGMTTQEIANETNIPYVSMHKYENGYIFPSPLRLIQIADTLQVSTDFLLGRVDHIM